MHNDDRGQPARGEDLHQPARDPLRQHNRQTGVDAEPGELRNRFELLDEPIQVVIVEQERISARQEHLINAGVGCDGRHGLSQPSLMHSRFAVRKAAAKTVTAVDRTAPSGQQQGPASVFLHKRRGRQPGLLIEWIGAEARLRPLLVGHRQHLPQKGVAGISGPHACHKSTRHEQRKVGLGGGGFSRDLLRKAQHPAEFAGITDRFRQQLLPALPTKSAGSGRPPVGCRHRAWQRGFDSLGLCGNALHRAAFQWTVADPVGGPCGFEARASENKEPTLPSYNTSEFRKGLKVQIDGDPYIMVECNFVKPGKGQALYKCKLRNLLRGTILDRTYKSGDSLEAADISTIDAQYLYKQGEQFVFMDNDSYEQYELSAEQVDDAWKWIKEGTVCSMLLYNGNPISMEPPQHMVLKVEYAEPAVRGNTATNLTKPVKLETGAEVLVPAFIEQDELIKVDTRTGDYLERVKE